MAHSHRPPGLLLWITVVKDGPFSDFITGVLEWLPRMGPCPNSIITNTGKSKSGSPLQNLKTEPPTEQCRRRCPERQACYEGETWGGGAGQTLWFVCLLHLSPQFIYFCFLCASDLSSFADSVRPPVRLSAYEPTHREVTIVTRGANADTGLRP